MHINTKEENARRWKALKNMGFTFKKARPMANNAGFRMSHSEWDFKLTIYVDYNKKMTTDEVYERWLQNAEEYTHLLKSTGWADAIPQIFKPVQEEKADRRLSRDHTFKQENLL